MVTMQKMWIGVDGLVAIARNNGLVAIFFAIAPSDDGLTCTVDLVIEGERITETVSMKDVAADGIRLTHAWEYHPRNMLRSYATRKVIEKHFKEAVEAAQKEISGDGNV